MRRAEQKGFNFCSNLCMKTAPFEATMQWEKAAFFPPLSELPSSSSSYPPCNALQTDGFGVASAEEEEGNEGFAHVARARGKGEKLGMCIMVSGREGWAGEEGFLYANRGARAHTRDEKREQ